MVKFITDNSLNHLELGFEKALRHVDRFHLAPIQASLALSHRIVSIEWALPSSEALVAIVRELGSIIFEHSPDIFVRAARAIFTSFSSAPEQSLVE